VNSLPVKAAELGVEVFVANRFPDNLERLNILGALCGREFCRFGASLKRGLLRQCRSVNEQSKQNKNADGRSGDAASVDARSLGHGFVVSPIELQETSGPVRERRPRSTSFIVA
jgi:hypothetical protein